MLRKEEAIIDRMMIILAFSFYLFVLLQESFKHFLLDILSLHFKKNAGLKLIEFLSTLEETC
ncbi:hypothetical protein A6R71_11480 [Xanthomonas translucens pv. arrhenatheri]|uniref:Putative membrane protein n=1 Tax=Xanthomonas graminis pv. arrhenatheri LMG 727 TaxID=1195923 RepID=A0A0K3A6A5_9XANT|nr:hypothetical protein A6R71_11480 [Xanthomonas translucens pv. arrhenatheri]CTP92827.1 putative membrane protein [Xanthomonas translucens pv. arrhenatheri LMG 727]